LALWLCYYFVLGPARELWLNYWLVGDGQQSVAVITHADWAGHGVFVYRYRANQKTYTGQDPRSYQNPKYANVCLDKRRLSISRRLIIGYRR